MDVPSSIAAAPAPVPEAAVGRTKADAERVQLARLAHEFEAMFLSEMLRGMRESMLSSEQDEGLGAETMTDTFDGEIGVALSKGGGLGLATVLLDALSRRDAPPGGAADAAPEPASAGATLPGPVTSPFGWRADPLTGQRKFHAGTDIRMAYGGSVEAVAAGRVVSVSERSGYGLTVVVDHGNGLETRYAHLSAASVREGDLVAAGQVVAQSGNSGRSTGPHLHLEARQNGHAIDPRSLLKDSPPVADFYADRNSVRSSQ